MSSVTPTLPRTMKAALFYAPGDVRYEDTAVPTPGPGELLMRIDTALTCGTDIKCFRRGHPVLLKDFPSPFGHECAGTVAAVGEGVKDFAPGDRIVAANSAPCMECFYCRKGDPNLCEHLDLLNGAYAEYLRVPARIVERNTYKVPDHVPLEAAAFCEPLAVSLRGVDLSDIQPGHEVAVIGLGPIGQLLVHAAKLKGARVTAVARNPLKLQTAVEFGGADATVNLREVSFEDLKAHHSPEGMGFDVVIEAVGLPETWQRAIALTRRGGLVNLFGGCPSGSTVELDTRRLHYDEIRLISLFHHTPAYFKKALDAIASGQVDPTGLISGTMGLDALSEAFERVQEGQAVKIALKPSLSK